MAGELALGDFRKRAWDDDLDAGRLRDAVQHVHTVVFGRLVAALHTMQLLGEAPERAIAFGDRAARAFGQAGLPK